MERMVAGALSRSAVAAAAAVFAVLAGADGGKNHYILDCEPVCAAETPARGAAIGRPIAVATDPAGRVYISSQSVVFRLELGGALSRIAGTGVPGFAGDGGPAVDALLNFPELTPTQELDDWPPVGGGIAADAAGNVYIADHDNHRVRRVDASGVIATVASVGAALGVGADWRLYWPQGVAVGADGEFFVTTSMGMLLRVGSAGDTSVLHWGNCGERDDVPGLCAAGQVARARDGSLISGDYLRCRLQRFAPDGRAERVAGRPQACGYDADGLPAAASAVTHPAGVALDGTGAIYFADMFNHCVRKVDGSGNVRTVAGRCRTPGFGGDGGAATDALLWRPRGVAVDRRGNLYIADGGNGRVRRVDRRGVISTVAGNGGAYAPSP